MTQLLCASLSLVSLEGFSAHVPGVANAVAGALLSAMWEGALLVVLVALALRLLPGLSAAMRARLWLVVMSVLLALPAALLVVREALPQDVLHAVRVGGFRPLQVNPLWSVWLGAAWVVLGSARALRLGLSAVRLGRVARAAVPVDLVPELAPLLKHRGRAVELCATAEAGRPSVVGFLRPRILIPPALLDALKPEELRQVLLHEMEHLRRRDDWTNLAQKLALVLLPLDPALFWVERRLCAERELACDDAVLRAMSSVAARPSVARKAYAACLVALAEHRMLQRGAALALGAWERQSELARRVHRILLRPEPTLQPAAARRRAAGLLGGVLAGATLLAAAPQLISFQPEPSGAAVASTSTPMTSGVVGDRVVGLLGVGQGVSARPVMAQMDREAAHVTLASATLPAGSAVGLHRAARRNGAAGRPRGSLVRAKRAVAEDRQDQRLREAVFARQVSWRGMRAASKAGLVFLAGDPEAVPVLALAVEAGDEEFSPSYAAVPVRGGWLLVQL